MIERSVGLKLKYKKGDSPGYPRTIPLKMGTKKGKGTPIALEVPLPVIFSTFNRGGYLLQGKRCPISNREIITLFLLPTPSNVFSVARNSLALPTCGLALAREPVHKSVFRGIFQIKVSRYP